MEQGSRLDQMRDECQRFHEAHPEVAVRGFSKSDKRFSKSEKRLFSILLRIPLKGYVF
jgi:hypothetical protein